MAFGSELEAVSKWMFTKIKSVPQIYNFVGDHPSAQKTPQIYFNKALEGSRVPYVVYTYLGGSYRNGNSGRKILKKLKFSVQFVTAGDTLSNVVVPLAHLEAIFQNDQMSGDVVIIGSHLESEFSMDDVLDGGQRIKRTGIIVNISAYPYNANQV
jgi:hypothetical protein